MGANYLVQLAAEWYEFQGYLVLRNVPVASAAKPAVMELDVLATHPHSQEFVHLEASMDSDSWQKRERRFKAKFRAARAHLEALTKRRGKKLLLRQRALLVYAGSSSRRSLGGGELVRMPEFLHEIIAALGPRRLDRQIVPEHLPLLRTLQFASEYRDDLFARDQLF